MSKRARLRDAFTTAFPTVQDALKDSKCADAAPWIISSIMNPKDPAFIAVPDPDAPGGEIVAALCKRFGIH
jgi:hypothetical protein